MPRWVHPYWQCPHCDFKAKDFDAMLDHAKEVGKAFFDALDERRDKRENG